MVVFQFQSGVVEDKLLEFYASVCLRRVLPSPGTTTAAGVSTVTVIPLVVAIATAAAVAVGRSSVIVVVEASPGTVVPVTLITPAAVLGRGPSPISAGAELLPGSDRRTASSSNLLSVEFSPASGDSGGWAIRRETRSRTDALLCGKHQRD